MSVFKISSSIDFGPDQDYYYQIPKNWKNPKLYKVDADALVAKVEEKNLKYGGSKLFTAKIEFPGFKPDFSMIQVAYPLNRPDDLLDKEDDWAILLCPLGNVNMGNVPSICATDKELCESIYKKHCDAVNGLSRNPDLPSIISYFFKVENKFDTIKDVIKNGKKLLDSQKFSSLNLSELIPSRTSLTIDFTNAGFRAPTIEELDDIFDYQ